MKFLQHLLLVLVFFVFSAFCGNIFIMNADGERSMVDHGMSFPVLYQSFNIAYFQAEIDTINQDYTLKYKYEYQALSDKSLFLMKTGRSEEAVKLLEDLNKKYPDTYNIVANLGTAYELVGKSEAALTFIKKALELNSESHRGSEWFHVKVLEAKLEIEKNPDWLKENKILNIEVSDTTKYYDFAEIKHDILYQLAERVPFTPKPDAILASIFNELGDACQNFSIENAYLVYSIGIKYDADNSYGMRQKRNKMQRLMFKYGLETPNVEKYFPAETAFSKRPHSTNWKKTNFHNNIDWESMPNSSMFERLIRQAVLGLVGVVTFIVLLIMRKRRKRKKE